MNSISPTGLESIIDTQQVFIPESSVSNVVSFPRDPQKELIDERFPQFQYSHDKNGNTILYLPGIKGRRASKQTIRRIENYLQTISPPPSNDEVQKVKDYASVPTLKKEARKYADLLEEVILNPKMGPAMEMLKARDLYESLDRVYNASEDKKFEVQMKSLVRKYGEEVKTPFPKYEKRTEVNEKRKTLKRYFNRELFTNSNDARSLDNPIKEPGIIMAGLAAYAGLAIAISSYFV